MPIVALVLVVGAAIAAIAVLVLRGRAAGEARRIRERIDALLKVGRYEQAAAVALQHERLDEAMEYYRRAQLPAKAAQVAIRLSRFEVAAELYARAGDAERSAQAWTRAGQPSKAAELRAATARRSSASLEPPASGRGSAPEATPRTEAPAAIVDRALDRMRAAVEASTGSDLDVAEVQTRARDAAEALLAAGELRRAAEVFRDGGLDDEAVHLFANVLGAPAEAARILAARGRHDRAAELYEIARDREAAAREWTEAARGSPDPAPLRARAERLLGTADSPPPQLAAPPAPAAPASAIAHAPPPTIDAIAPAEHAERAATNVLERLVADGRLSPDELAAIAREAARAAVEQLRHADAAKLGASGRPTGSSRASTRRDRSRATIAPGLEQQPLDLDLVVDDEVRAARSGPSVEALSRLVGEGPCSLQNIEVYYRLGLAWLARGGWREALACFDAVEEVSPGFHQAGRRAGQIRSWLRAVGSARLGGASQVGDGPESPRYELLGELGRGGMAVVYRARDTVLGRDVALKFMSESVSAKPRRRELFGREARAVAQLNHPNIVTLYDFGVLEGRLFICMEYLEGRSLDQRIDDDGHLPVLESLRLARQVLDALAYAHASGVVHCDVKPSNVFLTTAGVAKLMDFGLSRSMADQAASAVAGTPVYMAPEQIFAKGIDARTDVFALGVSLYEMLTGALPWSGFDRSKPPLPPRAHFATIPVAVEAIVTQAMAVDPADRYASAREMLAAVRAILEQVDSDRSDR